MLEFHLIQSLFTDVFRKLFSPRALSRGMGTYKSVKSFQAHRKLLSVRFSTT